MELLLLYLAVERVGRPSRQVKAYGINLTIAGDFSRRTPDRTMYPEVDSASESEYQGFLLG